MSPDRNLSRRPARATRTQRLGALLAVPCLLAAGAHAQDAGPSPDRLVRLAEQAEREPDFDRAEVLYQRAVDADPTSRAARRARTRLEWMRERRDERRGYDPLEILARARRANLVRSDLARLHQQADRMSPGRVKRETLFLVAETWFRRLGEPARAIPHYEELIASPGITPQEADVARVGLAEARAALGDRDRAVEELERAGLGGSFEARDLRTAERRATLRGWALGLLAASLLLLVGAAMPWRAGWRGARAALAPRRLLLLLYVVAVPAAIAELYERGTGESFLLFGLVALPVLVLGAVGAEALRADRAGRTRRLLALAGVVVAPFALAYLVLEQQGGLASFGM